MFCRVKSLHDIRTHEVTKIVHTQFLSIYCQKERVNLTSELMNGTHVLLIENLPSTAQIVDVNGEFRSGLPFRLRSLVKLKLSSVPPQAAIRLKREESTSPFDKIPPLSASVVEYEKAQKRVNVSFPTVQEVLKNPELQAIKPVNIDPVSMAVDDAATFIEEGQEFIKNPTWAGAAMMAIVAIPGKLLDDAAGKLVKEALERNPTKTIKGRKIINSDLAGKAVETKGGVVWFDYDGFPDFTPYAEKIVRIEGLTGSMYHDEAKAMAKTGLTDFDRKTMVWHHHQDGKTMMLVPKSVHSSLQGGVAHTGGRAVIEHNRLNPGKLLEYPSPMEKL